MAHILVIEDNEQFRDALVTMLTEDRHQVTQAKDGVEGLRLCREVWPDLIVTDIVMPGMDGFEVLMELRRHRNGTPVIAISGDRRLMGAELNLETARLLGAKATLVKPFATSELRETIERALA